MTADADVASLDACRAILAPIADHLRWQPCRTALGVLWLRDGTGRSGRSGAIGRGSTMLGAYRQAAGRFLQFGADGLRHYFLLPMTGVPSSGCSTSCCMKPAGPGSKSPTWCRPSRRPV